MSRLLPAFAFVFTICVVQGLVSVIHGTVKKVDKGTKNLVKTADGT